jgi:hypothetical protein
MRGCSGKEEGKRSLLLHLFEKTSGFAHVLILLLLVFDEMID